VHNPGFILRSSARGLSLALFLCSFAAAQSTTVGDSLGGKQTPSKEGRAGKDKSASEVAGPAPRMPDGKPDFSGTWGGGGVMLYHDFPDKQLPYTAAGKAAYNFNMTKAPDPQSLCIIVGEPRSTFDGYPFEIVQSPTRLAFIYERDTSWRLVPLDRDKHTKDPDPTFFGESVSHWEGDTLVVDVTGIKGPERIWTDNEGHPQSGKMHVIEHWTRPDSKTLKVLVTIDDPVFYTNQFTVSRTLRLQKYEPAEFACDEFNIDRDHLGPGLGTTDGSRGFGKGIPGGNQ
jgi:hypothetical protein